MANATKLTIYIFRYAGSASAVKSEAPSYAMFSYMTPNSDWVFVKAVEINDVDDTTQDEFVQQEVATIDKAILEKRMDLESDLKELNDLKKYLLALTFEG